MIYMEPSSLGWRPLFKSWLNTRPKAFGPPQIKKLNDLFEKFVDPCIELIRTKTKVLEKELFCT